MSNRSEMLVAILNNRDDFNLACNQHWYRIPVSSAHRWLKDRWPPQWLSFYQTKVFGQEAYAIHYYAQVLHIRQVLRCQLFPDDYSDKRTRSYYQVHLASLQQLPKPIPSRRRRRIIFIPTTWDKFIEAEEINDLYDDSPLEDILWTHFKCWSIYAERQEYVTVKSENYALDFAVYCAQGKLDVETDGDVWHANPERAAQDNVRDNALETAGWKVLRFNTSQIREEAEQYCLSTVVENINKLGGLDEGKVMSMKINLNAPSGSKQLSLF
jgi:very-short-patch-repair endonuclease